MMCQRIGRPPISTSGFGIMAVSSLIRVPNPPARITTFMKSLPHRRTSRPPIHTLPSLPENRVIGYAVNTHHTSFDQLAPGNLGETHPHALLWSRFQQRTP